MRYIEKRGEPDFMLQFKEVQSTANLKANYKDTFREKRKLNNTLREEQHHICCYCQQVLTHYQGVKIGGAHNEHLIPEHLDVGDGVIDLDYNNIYACCIDSRGYEKIMQHCGESKHNTQIRGFIQEGNCNTFFKYNSLGEILPNGIFNKWEEYINNETILIGNVKDAYFAIKTLNLNCNQLKTDREEDFKAVLPIITNSSKEKIDQIIELLECKERYIRFIDMLLYFVKKKNKHYGRKE